MSAPEKATFVVGRTKFDQVVEVEYERGQYNLIRRAVNQRDEDQIVRGLSRDNLLAIAQVADLVKAWPQN